MSIKNWVKSLWLAAVCGLFIPCMLFAWPYPPAGGIVYTNGGLTNITNATLNVQALIEWLDDNALFSSSGYITSSTLNTRLGSTTTQTFGKVFLTLSPTNATSQLGYWHGCMMSVAASPGYTVITNSAFYHAFTNLTTTNYNRESWFSASTARFTPLVAGYYQVGFEGYGSDTCAVRIVNHNTSQVAYVGTTINTNDTLNASGIFYLDGTSTNYCYAEGLCYGGATTSLFSRVIFKANFLGN